MAVYQRGKNWYIDFTFHGQRVREMIGPSRKGAENVIAKRKAEIAENKYLDVRKDPEPVNFHEFAVKYMKWAKVNKKKSTCIGQLSMMRRLDKDFGDLDMRKITMEEMENYKTNRAMEERKTAAVIGSYKKTKKDGTEREIWYVDYDRQGKKIRKNFRKDQSAAQAFLDRSKEVIRPATVNREIALLKHMYTKAIEWGKVDGNPLKKVKFLKGEANRLRYLMPEELQKLLSNCPDYLKPIVTVAAHTGMRRGEIYGLKWDLVNMDQGIISLVDTKNHQRRDIPMNETVKAILNGLKRAGDHVFCKENGNGFSDLRGSFNTAVKKSGITDFHFHDLRHTFASNLVMQGVDILTVKELMGHKKLEMTLRYAHLAPSYRTRAVSILDQVFSLAASKAVESPKSPRVIMPHAILESDLSPDPPHLEGGFRDIPISN